MTPRITPGTRQDIGLVNSAIVRVAGLVTGGSPPNIFTTLARHRALFRRWLPFAGALMPGGRLPRDESELVILRVAHLCESEYEWHHHERLALTAGLTAEEVERVREGAAGEGWSPRRALLLRAVDELHQHRRISDALWSPLRAELDEVEVIELCMLTGHYEMLAMTLNTCRVQPDAKPLRPPGALTRLLRGGRT